MKRNLFIFLFLLFCAASCKNADKTPAPESENDVDAARNFIQAALNGDYEKAQEFMLRDSTNLQRMNTIERVNLNPEEKRGLMEASIHIQKVNPVIKDSVTIVIYSNSYKNDWDTLKVVKIKNQWLVDFKYLYDHDMDSITNKAFNKDSIK